MPFILRHDIPDNGERSIEAVNGHDDYFMTHDPNQIFHFNLSHINQIFPFSRSYHHHENLLAL